MFEFDLPPHLIAQTPCAERTHARLLVVQRSTATLAHHHICDLPELLAPGDLLILNDTRVVPARLLGRRVQTGGQWEGLFLRLTTDGLWEMLCQTRGRLHEGEWIAIEPGPLQLQLVRRGTKGLWYAQPNETEPAFALLQRHGQIPLPPYIRKGRANEADRDRYQTVFAQQPGAVAAPTAGLHFTPTLLEQLAQRGIAHAFVTLHVGWGTFQPMQSDDVTQHHMHSEWGQLPSATVDAIAACRQRGSRVIAVGTTSVRVLETVAAQGPLHPWAGDTKLFIYPPYTFRAVDGLLTNFHLPRTTLLWLVGAFTGVELLRNAYQTAIQESYRFFSYGDAMLVV